MQRAAFIWAKTKSILALSIIDIQNCHKLSLNIDL